MAAINRRLTDLTESTSSSSGSSLHSRSSSESLGAPSDTTAPSVHEDDFGRADDPTAIVGLACRLPGAQSSSKLWENILEQKDLQSKIPADRFTVDEFYHPNGANKGTARLSPPVRCLLLIISRAMPLLDTFSIRISASLTQSSSASLGRRQRPWTLNRECCLR